MRVLLVHGLGRTPLSLLSLAWRLRTAGHQPTVFGYLPALASWQQLIDRLRARLEGLAEEGTAYAAVGHSLGGVLLASALQQWPSALPRPVRLITLGTPTRVPRLARQARRLTIFRKVTGQVGERLIDERTFDAFSEVSFPWTAISGTRGWRGRWSPFGVEPNYGVVSLKESRPQRGSAHVQVDARHTFLMNNGAVQNIVIDCLGGRPL